MIRIGIAEDHDSVRRSLNVLIDCFEGMSLVLEAENGKELIEMLAESQIDVLLLDIQMPVMDGLEAGIILRKRYPELKILVLTNLDNTKTIKQVIQIGLHGLITKAMGFGELESAIRKLHKDGFYFEPKFSEIVKRIFENDKDFLSATLVEFSEREKEIVDLALKEYTGTEIAELLFISPKTVEKHKSSLIAKTGAKTFIGVITFALVHQIISIDDLPDQ